MIRSNGDHILNCGRMKRQRYRQFSHISSVLFPKIELYARNILPSYNIIPLKTCPSPHTEKTSQQKPRFSTLQSSPRPALALQDFPRDVVLPGRLSILGKFWLGRQKRLKKQDYIRVMANYLGAPSKCSEIRLTASEKKLHSRQVRFSQGFLQQDQMQWPVQSPPQPLSVKIHRIKMSTGKVKVP